MLVAWVPLAAQALYTLAALPYLRAILRARRSDQHSLGCFALLLGGHGLMVAWSVATAQGAGLLLAYALAALLAAAEVGVVLWYRRWPGGRPARARAAPRAHSFSRT